MSTTSSSWQEQAKAFKASINAEIPPEWTTPTHPPLGLDTTRVVHTCGILNPREVDIVQRDATGLRGAIAKGEHTSVEVITAFCKAAAICHQTTNCLVDFFPATALERAKWLDEEYKRTGGSVGPLHGVPISIKDLFKVKGQRHTLGFLGLAEIDEEDALVVQILVQAGAVLYAKTALPQAVMHLETASFLGHTVNPYNRTLTAGGSSGGESALVAGGGSVLGIGTDIGGSIRNPAALCGIYGFKPTVGRLPKSGQLSVMIGQESIQGTYGPIARSHRDLHLFMSVILASQPWIHDVSCVKIPWQMEEVSFKGGTTPKIGVMWDDGVVKLQPPMRRALQMAVDRIFNANFEVVEYQAYKAAENWDILRRLYFTDGGERVRNAAAKTGEPLLPLTQWILNQNSESLNASQLIELQKRRDAYRAAHQAHFNSYDIDVVLCVSGPGPAPVLETSRYWGYTSMFNLVDYPGGVFPTGLLVEEGDIVEERTEFLSESDKQVWEAYHPEKFKGAPLALQVVGSKWEDEMTLKAMGIISEVVCA